MPPYDERDEEENFTAKYPTSRFLEEVRAQDRPTTQEVADAVGCTRQNALYRLRKLEKQGRVGSEKKGNANIWFPSG